MEAHNLNAMHCARCGSVWGYLVPEEASPGPQLCTRCSAEYEAAIDSIPDGVEVDKEVGTSDGHPHPNRERR